MNEHVSGTGDPLEIPDQSEIKSNTVTVAAIIVCLQGLSWAAIAAWLAIGLFGSASLSFAGVAFEILLVVLAAAWIIATAVGLFRVRPWSRASTLAIEVLHGAVTVAAFQGLFIITWIGWVVVVPAVLVLVLLFSKSATTAFAHSYRER